MICGMRRLNAKKRPRHLRNFFFLQIPPSFWRQYAWLPILVMPHAFDFATHSSTYESDLPGGDGDSLTTGIAAALLIIITREIARHGVIYILP